MAQAAAPKTSERLPFRAEPQSRDTARRAEPAGPEATILALQRMAGNRAVNGLLRPAHPRVQRRALDPPDGVPSADASDGAQSSLGTALFKGQRLDSSRTLDHGVGARMRAAFGTSFSDVRVHTGSRSAALAAELNARAFTIGRDVVFGAGEYRPGTPVGDALIAHELAHVMQQRDGRAESPVMKRIDSDAGPLEAEADLAAVGAATRLWSGRLGMPAPTRRPALPRLRSALRLQRCAGDAGRKAAALPAAGPPLDAKTWAKAVDAAFKEPDQAKRSEQMTALAQQALSPLQLRVRAAGTTHPDVVDPADYEPAPMVNFDVALHHKKSWRTREGKQDKQYQLDENAGYHFTTGDKSYVVIGPKALAKRNPAETRMFAEHELYHGTQPKGLSDADAELDAWTRDFVRYFTQLGRKGSAPGSFRRAPYNVDVIYFGSAWDRLVGYYERAGEKARAKALSQLVAYYQRGGADVQELFALWLTYGGHLPAPKDPSDYESDPLKYTLRADPSKQLIRDLRRELKLVAPVFGGTGEP